MAKVSKEKYEKYIEKRKRDIDNLLNEPARFVKDVIFSFWRRHDYLRRKDAEKILLDDVALLHYIERKYLINYVEKDLPFYGLQRLDAHRELEE